MRPTQIEKQTFDESREMGKKASKLKGTKTRDINGYPILQLPKGPYPKKKPGLSPYLCSDKLMGPNFGPGTKTGQFPEPTQFRPETKKNQGFSQPYLFPLFRSHDKRTNGFIVFPQSLSVLNLDLLSRIAPSPCSLPQPQPIR